MTHEGIRAIPAALVALAGCMSAVVAPQRPDLSPR